MEKGWGKPPGGSADCPEESAKPSSLLGRRDCECAETSLTSWLTPSLICIHLSLHCFLNTPGRSLPWSPCRCFPSSWSALLYVVLGVFSLPSSGLCSNVTFSGDAPWQPYYILFHFRDPPHLSSFIAFFPVILVIIWYVFYLFIPSCRSISM